MQTYLSIYLLLDVPPVHLDVGPALPPPLAQLEGCRAHEAAGVLEQGAAVEVHQSLHAGAGGWCGVWGVLLQSSVAADWADVDGRQSGSGFGQYSPRPGAWRYQATRGDLNTVEWRIIIQCDTSTVQF